MVEQNGVWVSYDKDSRSPAPRCRERIYQPRQGQLLTLAFPSLHRCGQSHSVTCHFRLKFCPVTSVPIQVTRTSAAQNQANDDGSESEKEDL